MNELPRKILPLLLVPLAVLGCQPAGQAGGGMDDMAQQPAMSAAEVRGAVDQVRAAWVEAAQAGDAAAVSALYTDDAVMVGADGNEARGRAAIQDALAAQFGMLSDLSIQVADFGTEDGVAYETGTFSQTMTPAGGEAASMSGRYMVVLLHQDDGSWKIRQHLTMVPEEPDMGDGM